MDQKVKEKMEIRRRFRLNQNLSTIFDLLSDVTTEAQLVMIARNQINVREPEILLVTQLTHEDMNCLQASLRDSRAKLWEAKCMLQKWERIIRAREEELESIDEQSETTEC